ncbi:MAG: D-alanine--D-alanine ligase, partial [Bacteroidota bacterium]
TIAALEDAVRRRGHRPRPIGNLQALLAAMQRGPLALDAAITIAESYGSRNREAHAPVLLELAGVPCLGSDALALSVSLDKALTKTVVRAAGVPTPDWAVIPARGPLPLVLCPFPLFIKPRYEGTAKGIAPSSRCETPESLRTEAERQRRLYGQDLIAEAFVEGAEFTVGVVGTGADAEALPVLQRATERVTGIGLHALERFDSPEAPLAYDVDAVLSPELEARLQADALAAHRALECADFSRSDFRVDASGAVWFIEINPLPTFAPDGTFAILAELVGEPYPEFLAAVLARGLARLGVR